MKKVTTLLLICFLWMGCAGALAQVQPRCDELCVVEVYDLTNRREYQLSDSEYPGGWRGIVGHQYRMDVDGTVGSLRYRSSRSSVASVSSSGLITCKAKGETFITVTDRATRAATQFRLRVSKNEKAGEADYIERGDWDDEVGFGVYSTSKRVYLRGSTLYVDMYIVNATNAPVRNVGAQSVYVATPWNSIWSGDMLTYQYAGRWDGRISTVQPYRARAVTVKLGRVDPKSIYLRNADAFCRGGVVRGSLYWVGMK